MQMKSSAWQHRQQTLQAFENLLIAWFLISTITLLSPSQIPVLGRLQCMNMIQLTWPLWIWLPTCCRKHTTNPPYTSLLRNCTGLYPECEECCAATEPEHYWSNRIVCPAVCYLLTEQFCWYHSHPGLEKSIKSPSGCSNLNTYISKFDHLSWTWQTTLWIRLKWTKRWWFLGTLEILWVFHTRATSDNNVWSFLFNFPNLWIKVDITILQKASSDHSMVVCYSKYSMPTDWHVACIKYNALPEMNTVQAEVTRTSLVDGITLFCFTCANNIRLVCG